MQCPRVTIVTPSYNQGQFLDRAISSIINQNYPDLEYIVIDGGSTDNSVEIIKKYEKHFAYWVSEKDKGQSDAINKGMRRATGDIVGWVNSDDILLPGALTEVARLAQENPDRDIFMGRAVRIDDQDKILFFHIVPQAHPFLYKNGIFSYFSQPNWFWRRSVFDKIGYLNIERHACMDLDFFIRQLRAGLKIAFTPRQLAALRMYEGTKTSQDNPDSNNIWSVDRAAMREIHKDFKYGNDNIVSRFLYRILKIFNGMYAENIFLNLKFKHKNIKDFIQE
jgi:glycosyltransferase involved in cell wall biosynthesis